MDGWLFGWSVGVLLGWLVDWLVVNSLVSWFVAWLVYWLVGWLLIDWLVDRVVGLTGFVVLAAGSPALVAEMHAVCCPSPYLAGIVARLVLHGC